MKPRKNETMIFYNSFVLYLTKEHFTPVDTFRQASIKFYSHSLPTSPYSKHDIVALQFSNYFDTLLAPDEVEII